MEIGFDINVAVANVTWAMVAGERSGSGGGGSGGDIRPFLEAVNKGIELASTSAVLLFMPFLAKIFPERYLGLDQVRRIDTSQGISNNLTLLGIKSYHVVENRPKFST